MIYGLRFTLWGVALAVAIVAVYLGRRIYLGRKLELAATGALAFAAASATGGVKIAVFAVMPEFEKAANASAGRWYSLSEGDAVFVLFGGVALIWVSLQEIIRGYKAP